MSIQIISSKNKPLKKKIKPHYYLIINYMIGDSNGDTIEESEISLDNPFLERFCKILKKLKNPKGCWGIKLDEEAIEANYKQKCITKDEKDFFLNILQVEGMEEEESDKFFKSEEEAQFAVEISELIRTETEYSFLTYQGFELFYVDENKKRHKTRLR